MTNYNLISYSAFLKDRRNFQQSCTRGGNVFNQFDTPSHQFFKILFYFWNGDNEGVEDMSGGLLAPTWQLDIENYYEHNSAWAYLKMNDENERAEKLEQFITLLSNINSDSPWYFSEVMGLGEVLDRKQTNGDFKIDEERKKISIKCLPDPYDQRIGTLLDLYRDIVWSWSNKREVVPANLRKFDMGLYIWESPIYALTSDSVLDESTTNNYSSSYKFIEFHNCEFDYNSIKSGYESISNKEGTQSEYTIDIYFDDCYERRYNNIMMRTIGDVIITDTATVSFDDNVMGKLDTLSIAQGEEGSFYNNDIMVELNNNDLQARLSQASGEFNASFINGAEDESKNIQNKTLPEYSGSYKEPGFVGTLLNEVGGAVVRDLSSSTKRLLLGNLYTYSISRMADQLQGVFKGQISTALSAVDQYTGTNIINNLHNKSLNNLSNNLQQSLNKKVLNRKLGRLYEANTLANNI